MKNLRMNSRKKTNSILILSQNTLGEELFKLSVELSNTLKDVEIYFKLHPKQYTYYENISINIPKNMRIIGEGELTIYELFPMVNFQVGVFSTALFEGLSLGVKTIIYNADGSQFLEELIDKGYAILAKNISDIALIIERDKFRFPTEDYFFSNNSLLNINNEIKHFLD